MGNSVKSQICCGMGRHKTAAAPVDKEESTGSKKVDERGGLSQGRGQPQDGRSAQPSQKFAEDPQRRVVEEIDRLAMRIETSCRKFPTSGAKTLAGSKDRYIAVVPAPDSSDIPGTGWSKWRNRWRRGHLGYWASRDDFHHKREPKGEIDLASIAKIHWEAEHPDQVHVKHFAGQEKLTLVICLGDADKAKQWRDVLRHLRSLL
mmetsp:Transcript_95146/g.296193  ORF Transcript_95146/g.296193 Transcript_95146/m.296193 type:complete len:204 (-) Transcript_95146:33-644(-)